MTKEIKTFADLRAYLSGVPKINEGGCGYAAYFMYEWLKKEGKKPVVLFAYYLKWPYSSKGAYEQNKRAANGQDKPTSCSHVLVKVGRKVFDSSRYFKKAEGKCDIRQFGKFQAVNEKFLVKALSGIGWNSTFDYKTMVPKMEEATGITFEDHSIQLKLQFDKKSEHREEPALAAFISDITTDITKSPNDRNRRGHKTKNIKTMRKGKDRKPKRVSISHLPVITN